MSSTASAFSVEALRSRLIKSIGGMAYGQLVTVFAQLATVPFFIHAWGAERYGEWVILSAIPAYLSMSDIGLASVASNEMTMSAARGDRDEVIEMYQSSWLFISIVSLAVFAASLLAIATVDFPRHFHIHDMGRQRVGLIVLCLALQTIVSLQGSSLSAAFRATGHNGLGMFVGNSVRLAEVLATLLLLLLGGDALALAAALLLTRVLGTVATAWVMHAIEPWLELGWRRAHLRRIRPLLRPALAFMSFPLCLSFSLQGVVMVIGAAFGPAAVAVFSIYRTLSRLLVQAAGTFSHAAWPELSASFAAGHIDLARRMLRRLELASLAIGAVGGVALFLLGDWIVHAWLHHDLPRRPMLLLALVATAALDIAWQPAWIFLMSINRHQRFALLYLGTTLAGFAAFATLTGTTRLELAMIPLVLAELPLLVGANRLADNVFRERGAA